MKLKFINTTLSGLLLSVICSVNVANAALIDRGNGLIYDDTQNITWLQDASYAKTSGYDSDGRMNWNESLDWAAQLSYDGGTANGMLTGWRLFNAGPDGTYCVAVACAENELAQMYYNDFGLTRGSSVLTLSGGTNASFNLFSNLSVDGAYWSQTAGSQYDWNNGSGLFADRAWVFRLGNGDQNTTIVYNYQSDSYNTANVWAVRDGDVAQAQPPAIPEPGTLALLSLGLIGVVSRRFSKKY
jgi:hypothetical protein